MKLKALMLTLLLAVSAVGSVQAQSFKFGLESGMNFSYFLGDNNQSLSNNLSNSRLGFVGGGFLSLDFGPTFAIRPEVLYEQKGAQVTGTTSSYEVDYVEVPVLVKFGFGVPILPCILVGPSFNWSTASSLASGSGVNSGDVGLVGGIEYDFGQFDLSGRYELGLDNVTSNSNLQNGTITVLMGYSFI